MIDPLTAFAAIKGGISAGKQIHSMSKEIAGFFDSVDGAKKAHEKKKNSLFASSNEEAMDTWMQKQQAIDAEAQLRELIVNTRGFSAYQDLLKLRRDIAKERKERERREERERQEKQELIAIIMVVLTIMVAIVGLVYWALDYRGYL
jgi:hypothetical protein